MGLKKNNSISIRKASDRDIKEIALLHFSIVNNFMSKIAPSICEYSTHLIQLSDVEKSITEIMKDPDHEIIIACNENKVIGFLSVVTEKYTDDLMSAPFSTIEYIEVDPNFQSLGIGQILLEEAEKIAHSKGHKYIELSVWETNEKAIKLYERNGFCAIERRMAKKL